MLGQALTYMGRTPAKRVPSHDREIIGTGSTRFARRSYQKRAEHCSFWLPIKPRPRPRGARLGPLPGQIPYKVQEMQPALFPLPWLTYFPFRARGALSGRAAEKGQARTCFFTRRTYLDLGRSTTRLCLVLRVINESPACINLHKRKHLGRRALSKSSQV